MSWFLHSYFPHTIPEHHTNSLTTMRLFLKFCGLASTQRQILNHIFTKWPKILTSALFWDFTQHRMIVPAFRNNLSFKDGTERKRPEPSVPNHHSTLRNIPEEHSYKLHRCASLKSCKTLSPVHLLTSFHYHVTLCQMASLLTCSLPFQLIINKYLYFRLHDMLRTGLVKMDGGKVASVESELRSVSLRQVTPIIVVLASGVLTAILIGVVERLKAQHCEWRGIGTLITNKTFKPANLTFLNTSQCACCDQTCQGGFRLGWVVVTVFSSPTHPQPIPSGRAV